MRKRKETVDLSFISRNRPEITLEAEPQNMRFPLSSFALVIVDMQNAFTKKGGMFDRNGFLDASKTRRMISAVQRVSEAARRSQVRIVYLAHVYDKSHSNAGGTDSPNYWKEMGVASPRANPDFERLGFLTEGSWDSEIIDELTPWPNDIVIRKTRYSGFTNPLLAKALGRMKTKVLGFVGVATNVCVESTLRDAYFSEHFPVLFEDACLQLGSTEAQEATINTIRMCFGWTSTSSSLVRALSTLDAPLPNAEIPTVSLDSSLLRTR